MDANNDLELENYASDASENDDIIDDDQELLALLRGEHSALYGSSSTDREQLLHSDTTDLSKLASTSSYFGGAPTVVDTIPARGAPASQASNLSLYTVNSSDLTGYQTEFLLHGITAVPMEEIAESSGAPEPLVSLGENVALTDTIRTQAARSLAVNRIYQDLLSKHLQEVSAARARNRDFNTQLQDLIQRRETAQQAPFLPSTKTRLCPPYFFEQNGDVPPDNEDTIKRKKQSIIDHAKKRRWSERERTNLKAGVISENKRILFEALSEAGDVDGIQSLNSAPDMDMMVNTKGLDWNRISQRFVDTRTAKECLIQWTGIDHPGISKADWSNIEIANLDELVKKYQERNWIQIALDLDTNRTSAQCFRKYMSRKATRTVSKLPWSDQEDAILKEAVQMIGEKNWQQISYCFDNRTAAQCMHRWSKSINPSIRRGRWTEEEDGALRISATTFGESHWTKVQHHILGRTDVQCRERYMNVLSPKVKSGPWTDEENIRLVELVEVDGMKKWSDVALNMEGRTDNQCARRYRMICKEEETGRLYKSNRRRKGRTTLAQLSTPDKQQPKQQPEASSPVSQKREKGKNHSRNKQEVRVEWLREKKLRVDYDAFAWRYRRIYDLWDERWGKFVDPIEKVFNLGVPPTTPLQGASEDEVSISNPIMPEPASVLRPGRIRPVPPCSATMNAFSRNITQGEYLDGRFRLRNVINNGSVVTNSLTTTPLSSEEMNRPEYKELADRFDAVFLWPMMMGMLHMGAARELIQTPPDVLLGNGTPSQQQPSAPAVPSTEESAPAVPSTEESAQSTPQPATAMIETATSSAKASSSRGKRKPKQTEASDPSSAPAKRQKRKTPAA